MILKDIRSKKSKFLCKSNSCSLLSKIFSYIPKKRTIKILQINKKLLSSLNLSFADYYLDKKYQEIIENSDGNLNYIFLKSFDYYKQLYIADLNEKKISFTKLISNIIKYLKYLLLNKKIKTLILSFEEKMFINNWLYFKFSIEVIRNIKYGLSLKLNKYLLNYRYYEVIKDSIHDLKEINSITLFNLKSK